MNAIEIKDLTKTYGTITALDHINLTISRGSMFTIVGPDGAGKTTLLQILTGIVKPDDGIIHVLGKNVKTEMNQIKPDIGYLTQGFSLYQDLTIDENIEFFAEIHQVRDYKEKRDELLDFMRLKSFRNRMSGKLSGGMKQKLALACTLIYRPKIIFLDEPTTGVDPVSRRDFWMILARLIRDNITIVMTTPYMDEAERADTIALLNKGRLLLSNTPENVKQSLHRSVFHITTDSIQETSLALQKIPTIVSIQLFGDRIDIMMNNIDTSGTDVEKLLHEHGITITGVRKVSPTLENVFIHLLGKEGTNP